ncbi:MAG TPA: hypothetical protein VN787_03085 [Steroidobacteraceae bacterium]|nr:hypothetical protein [Steroidobacteraceae bacterium]
MTDGTVLRVASLEEFFRAELHGAAEKQHLALAGHTEHYVVNMLATFSRADAFFEPTPSGPRLKPLALMLAEALGAPTLAERQHALQRLGDVSLFIAGFLPQSFARKLVDVDYHIAMGGRAYSSLADSTRGSARGRGIAAVFSELAAKFRELVDALNEIAEAARPPTHDDLLRLYEVWIKTGSARAAGRLRALGVEPAATSRVRWSH